MVTRKVYRKLQNFVLSCFPYRLVVRTLTREKAELHDLILHANFQILVDYVECKCARRGVMSSGDRLEELKFWEKVKLYLGIRFRSSSQGLKYLRQESSINDVGGKLTLRASEAKNIYDLYWWWIISRKFRKDPISLVITEPSLNLHSEKIPDSLTKEERAKKHQWILELDAMEKLKNDYYQEDNEKLKELIDIRNSLWV